MEEWIMEVFVFLVGLVVIAAIFDARRGKVRDEQDGDYWEWD